MLVALHCWVRGELLLLLLLVVQSHAACTRHVPSLLHVATQWKAVPRKRSKWESNSILPCPPVESICRTTRNSNAAEGYFFCRGPDFGHSAKEIFAEGQSSAKSDLRQRKALGQGPSLPRAGPSAKKRRSAVWVQSNGGSGR